MTCSVPPRAGSVPSSPQAPAPEEITSLLRGQLGSQAQSRSRFPTGRKAQDAIGQRAGGKEVERGLTEPCRAQTRNNKQTLTPESLAEYGL